MKGLTTALLVLALYQGTYAAYSGSRYSGRNSYSETTGYQSSNTSDKDKDKGYKIVIKLDDAFGKVADDLELLQELSSDMKAVKSMVEDLSQDMRELRGNLPDSENLIANSSATASRLFSSGSSGSGRSSSYDRTYRPKWEIALPKINCAELRLSGQKRSGVYSIQPDRDQQPFEAYCDMETDSGGWTVIQRRGVLNVPKSMRENFYRNWKDYEIGFGSIRSDYWLGLEKMAMLTKNCNHELIVNLTSWDNVSKFARYGTFNISGKTDSYRLTVADYTGNAGDGLLHHSKMKFTTFDKQNDFNGDENCATLYKGAWWYKDCFWSNLNGEYADDGADGKMTSRSGIEWGSRHFYSYMKTEMKIRPKC